MKVLLCSLLCLVGITIFCLIFRNTINFADVYAFKFKTNKFKAVLSWLIYLFWTVVVCWSLYDIGADLASKI